MDAQTTLELQDLEASTGVDLDTLVELISGGYTTEDNISEHVSNYCRGEFESRDDYIKTLIEGESWVKAVPDAVFDCINWDDVADQDAYKWDWYEVNGHYFTEN